jgi:hypothetical protein
VIGLRGAFVRGRLGGLGRMGSVCRAWLVELEGEEGEGGGGTHGRSTKQ